MAESVVTGWLMVTGRLQITSSLQGLVYTPGEIILGAAAKLRKAA